MISSIRTGFGKILQYLFNVLLWIREVLKGSPVMDCVIFAGFLGSLVVSVSICNYILPSWAFQGDIPVAVWATVPLTFMIATVWDKFLDGTGLW